MLRMTVTATPSLNDLKGRWAMSNWQNKYLRELKNCEFFALHENKRMKINIVRYGSRSLDKDNLYGGLKPLIDAIKKKGLIVDDSEKWLILECSQSQCLRGHEKTEVEIVEV